MNLKKMYNYVFIPITGKKCNLQIFSNYFNFILYHSCLIFTVDFTKYSIFSFKNVYFVSWSLIFHGWENKTS